MLGEYDSVSCIHGACNEGCHEEVQGADRLQRGLNYMGHLREALPGYLPVWSVYSDPHWFRHYHFGAWMSSAFQTWVFLERPKAQEVPHLWTPERQGTVQAWHTKDGVVCPFGKSSMWLYETPDKCHTSHSCKEKCAQDGFCRGFAMSSDLSDGRCWLYNSVAVDKCEKSGNFNLHYMTESKHASASKGKNKIIALSQDEGRSITEGRNAQVYRVSALAALVTALVALLAALPITRLAMRNREGGSRMIISAGIPSLIQDAELVQAEAGSAE